MLEEAAGKRWAVGRGDLLPARHGGVLQSCCFPPLDGDKRLFPGGRWERMEHLGDGGVI